MAAPLALTFGGITGVLVTASAVIGVLYARQRTPTTIELGKRISTWWVMFAVFALSLALDPRAFLCFSAVLSAVGLREYLRLVGVRPADRALVPLCFAAVVVQHALIALDMAQAALVFIPGFALLVVPAVALTQGETAGFVRSVSSLGFGLLVVAYGFGHAGLLLLSPAAAGAPGGGAGLIVFLVVVTQLNDVFQYLAGKAFGRTAIVPRISPKKTAEGLLGGVLGSALLALVLGSVLVPVPLWCLPLLGAALSLAGFVGDVTMSALKRDVGVKDAGAVLPGHGGVLDRIDSLIFTAPLFFHALPLALDLA